MPKTITASMAGCWLDEVHGQQRNNLRCFDLALEFGWVPEDGFPMASRIRDAYEDGQDYIMDVTEGKIDINTAMTGQGELVDQATAYLNDHAPEGYEVIWFEGNLFLQNEEGDDHPDDCDGTVNFPEAGFGGQDITGTCQHPSHAPTQDGHTADTCSGGGDAHDEHMRINGECPWEGKK